MNCPYCGKENVDRSPFCASCGKSLAGMYGEGAQPTPQSTPQSTPQPAPQPQAAPQPQHTPQAAPQPQPAYYQPPQPAQPVAAAPLYAKGCMGAAWSDITSSAGWFKKVLLLGLIMCVPILNFYVIGYAMRWARQLVLGKIEPMPQRIFEEGNFSQGFYAVVWLFVFALVINLVGGIIAPVPLLGALVIIAILIFQSMFGCIGVLRIAVSKRIGEAFSLPEDWRGFTKDFGSLFCASFVPELIISVFVFVVLFIVALIVSFVLFSTGAVAISYSYGYSSFDSMMQIVMALFSMAPLFLIAYYITSVFYAFTYLWTYRAVGHYVAREVPDWAALAPQDEPGATSL